MMQRRGFLAALGMGAAAAPAVAQQLGQSVGGHVFPGVTTTADVAAKYSNAKLGDGYPHDPYSSPEYQALRKVMGALRGKRSRALTVNALEHLEADIHCLKSVSNSTKLRMQRDRLIAHYREESAIEKAMSAALGDRGLNTLSSMGSEMLAGLDE